MSILFLNGYKWSPEASAVRDATLYLMLLNVIGSCFSLGAGALQVIISALQVIISALQVIIYKALGALQVIIWVHFKLSFRCTSSYHLCRYWVRLLVSFKRVLGATQVIIYQSLGATLGIISTPEERGQA